MSNTRLVDVPSLGPLTGDLAPDVRGARRIVSEARRIECVEIHRSARGISARVTGVWHRLPVTRSVPVATAVGLSAEGVRTLLTDEGAA